MSKATTSKTSTSTSKTTRTKKVVEPTLETLPVVEAPLPSLKSKSTKSKSVSVAEVVTVVEPTTVTEQVTEEVVEENQVTMKQRFEFLIKNRQETINTIKREIADLRKMQRDHELAVKEASKKKRRKTVRDPNNPRKPSGFASPVTVSDDLYSFLSQFDVKNGDPIARTDVTRYITTYIKDHDLQNPEHRREIIPDASLKKIFGPALEPKDPNDANSPLVYTYLKLQRYLSAHFPKKAVPVTTTV